MSQMAFRTLAHTTFDGTYLEHDLDHVLRPLVQQGLVQDVPQRLEDGVDAARGDLAQLLSGLLWEQRSGLIINIHVILFVN